LHILRIYILGYFFILKKVYLSSILLIYSHGYLDMIPNISLSWAVFASAC
jgi:hypothetical protein